MTVGDVDEEALGLVTLVGLITVFVSVYLITWSHTLYGWLGSYMGLFERKGAFRESGDDTEKTAQRYDVTLFGMGRYGQEIASDLFNECKKLLVVDFDSDVIRRWKKRGHEAVYGDACDPDFLGSLPLNRTDWVVSAMPQHDVIGLTHEDPRLALINGLKDQQF